jgi:serine/threonine-protein kinase
MPACADTSRQDWVEVFALLDLALELAPADHAGWLAALHPDQARLLPLLQALLQTHAQAGSDGFLQTPACFVVAARAGQTDAADPAGVATAPAEAAAQMLVGPYRLLREIGQGGMASVWLADRADGLLQRQVALKLPHVAWGERSLAERMARERNILSSLTHPHIARLYDAGFAADGRPYLALEYVDGLPINAYASAQGLSVPARLQLLLQVAQAVAHAHARLVVHRDLKPSNILVDAQGQAHLLDFGIARLMDPVGDDAAAGPAHTQAVGRAMTPDYASPEQIRGEAIGTASDVYSLGVVAYELLSGARPYHLPNQGAVALAAAVAALRVPLASSVAADPATRRALRGDLDAILNKALKHDVAERYPTIESLAQDLQRHLARLPVLARPDGLGYRVRKLWQRQRLVLSGATLLVVALAAGVGSTLWQARLARAEGERAVAIKQFLVGLFDNSARQGSGQTPAFEVTGQQLLELGTRRLLTEYGQESELRLELLSLLGTLSEELDLLQPAQRLLEEALALALQLHGADDVRHATARLNLAELMARQGNFEAALAQGTQSLRVLQGLHPQPTELLGKAEVLLGNVLVQLQRHAEARGHLEAAVARMKAAKTRGPQPARAAFYLARIDEEQGRLADAEALYLGGIAAAESDTGPQSYQAAFGYHNYGDLLRQMGRFAEAEQALRRALAVYEVVLGPQNLGLSAVRFDIGRVLAAVGRRTEADALYAQAIALSDQVAGPFHPNGGAYQTAVRAELALDRGDLDLANQLNRSLLAHWPPGDAARRRIVHRVGMGLARVQLLHGDLPAAQVLLDEVAAALAARGPSDRIAGPPRAKLMALQADLLRARGDLAGARTLLQAALQSPPPSPPGELSGPLHLLAALARSAPPPAQASAALQRFAELGDEKAFARRDVENQARLDHTLGRLLLQAGEPGAARDRLARALALREKIDQAHSPWLAETQLALAECLWQLKQPQAARMLVDQAQAILAAHPRAAGLHKQLQSQRPGARPL